MPELWDNLTAEPLPAAPNLWPGDDRAPVQITVRPPPRQPSYNEQSPAMWDALMAQGSTPPSMWPQRQAEMRSYEPSMAERLKGGASDFFNWLGADRYNANKLGDIVKTGAEMFPPTGIPLAVNEMERGVEERSPTSVGLAALGAIPGVKGALPSKASIKKAIDVPSIRGMSADDAIEHARKEYHLIKAGDQSEGLYVGGPREVQSKATLNKIRRDFDAYVAADPRGADWYDRYRRGVTEVTGGNPAQNRWMSSQEGQWSAGVDPGSEIQFALKENNSSIAGMPTRANYPAQHQAHLRALAAKDPDLYQLGEKTGEYATKVNPDQPLPPGATGVNDFRHARNFRYTEPSGAPQKGALGDAGHTFLDYETALAVDRANKMALGGRTDWTGERLQAAPWVRQKTLDIMSRNPALTYEEAFQRANRTIADYFDRHTYLATHEAQPGADVVGHMTASRDATPLARREFFEDPRSTWATAPGGRDAIYAGTGIEGTGNYMRVRPTVEMQGMYRRPDGTLETNPGAVARPLGTFDTGGKGEAFKSASPADRDLLNAGEAFRAYVDAQNAGAWHKLWAGGPTNQSNSLTFPRAGKATIDDLLAVQGATSKHGLPDVVDTGSGITATRFWPAPEGGPGLDRALRKDEFTHLGEPRRVKVDSDIVEYVDQWKKGIGSQAATNKMLEYVSKTPEIRAAFNNNPHIPQQALNKLERDQDWAKVWSAPREDIQNARRIIGEGPGWVDRLEAAVKNKAILPAAAAAIFAAASASQPKGAGREEL